MISLALLTLKEKEKGKKIGKLLGLVWLEEKEVMMSERQGLIDERRRMLLICFVLFSCVISGTRGLELVYFLSLFLVYFFTAFSLY